VRFASVECREPKKERNTHLHCLKSNTNEDTNERHTRTRTTYSARTLLLGLHARGHLRAQSAENTYRNVTRAVALPTLRTRCCSDRMHVVTEHRQHDGSQVSVESNLTQRACKCMRICVSECVCVCVCMRNKKQKQENKTREMRKEKCITRRIHNLPASRSIVSTKQRRTRHFGSSASDNKHGTMCVATHPAPATATSTCRFFAVVLHCILIVR
jgi:hypothetical protein